MNAAPPDDWLAWRRQRHELVTSVPGNLALVSYQPVTADPAPVEHIPGATAHRSADRDGIVLRAPAALGVEVGGTPVDGEVYVGRYGTAGAALVRSGSYWCDVFSLDGSDHELRVYDEHAENLSNFDSVEYFDHDERMVVAGGFSRYDVTDRVPWEFTRAVDTGHAKQVPGTITAELGGVERRLVAFLDGTDLVIVFADGTTGSESYAPGRFLRIPAPDGDGEVRLDFNRAFVPPCGFSDFYSCPLPPPQNKLDVPVRAGERRVRWRTPRRW